MKTISKLTAILILLMAVTSLLSASDYKLDKSKSTLNWTGKKVTGKHHGTIDFKKGMLVVDNKKVTSGIFEVDMQTIVCNDIENANYNNKLVGHLKSEDFFSTENHPVSTLKINNVKHLEGDNYQFSAELTIKDKTHPLTFDADVHFENQAVHARGTIEVDRTLYDIKYGSGKFFSGLGDNMIDDHFTLDFELIAAASSQSSAMLTK